MELDPKDVEHLVQEKYQGNRTADMSADLKRLKIGEPLAYVIGSIPFLGLTIALDSHPLIPRPETEWWAEELIKHIGTKSVHVLDLCAGSGAIGLSILNQCPNAHVSFGELILEHTQLIRKNLELNNLAASRTDIRCSDLFAAFPNERFDIIATNPPYIPDTRELPESVQKYEPQEALYAGSDGLSLIRRIAAEAKGYLNEEGEVWLECDISHTKTVQEYMQEGGFASVDLRTDQYGRERLIVAQL